MASWSERWTRARALGERALGFLGRIGFRSLRVLVVLAAIWPLGVYLTLGVLHVRHPYELEWMEGGMVDGVRRVAAGYKLYVKPSLDFVPYIYAPLWFYVAALFSKVFGAGFFSARLVSFLASVGVIAMVFRFVQRETKSAVAAIAAAGFFAGTYKLATAFYDIARVDSLFVLFLMGGLYVVRFHESRRSRAIAALLLTLAFLTKQSATLAIAPVALYVITVDKIRAWFFLACLGVMMGGSFLALHLTHDGWFYWYVFWLPRQHPWVKRMWTDFWTEDLLAPLAVSMILGVRYLIAERGAEGRRFYFFALAGALACSWIGRLHAGGWPNVNMPAFAMIAVLFGVGLGTGIARASAAGDAQKNHEAFFYVAAMIQFAALIYSPTRYLPNKDDRAMGDKLVAEMRAAQGEVYMPAHGYLPALAGKKTYAHEMAIQDIIGINAGKTGKELREQVRRAILDKKFAMVVPDTGFFMSEIELGYQRKSDAVRHKDALFPITGMRTRPKGIYVLR